MSEFVLHAAIFLAGWLLVSSLGTKGWGVVPLAFIAGTLMVIVTGFALVVTGLPTRPWLVLSATLIVAVGSSIATRPSRDNWAWTTLIAGVLILLPLVILFQRANLVAYHIDSFRYLVSAALLASDHYELATMDLLEKRLLSGPVIHSIARITGESYMQAFSPILALALLAFLAWMVQQAGGPAEMSSRTQFVSALAVMLLLTNNRMVFNSFYINNHLIFASALLAASSASYLAMRRGSNSVQALFAVLLLALPVLVVTRPEGFIAAGLVVLPMVLDRDLSSRRRWLVLSVYGSATFLWFAYVAVAASQTASGMSFTSTAPAAIGLLALVLAPVVPWSRLVDIRRPLLMTVEVALWCALVVFVARDQGILTESLRATFQNVVRGEGSWGYSLIVLGVLGVVAVATGRGAALVCLRFPLTSFIPVLLLLAYFRDLPYRVGTGDSLNRMLMQFLPLGVLYLAVVVLEGRVRQPCRPNVPQREPDDGGQ